MEKIAVYGCGVIGAGEATLVIGHSMPCVVIGHSEAGMERCRKTIEQHWDDMIANGIAEEKNKIAAMKLLTITNDPSALAGCTFIFEAVSEDIPTKQSAYEKIAEYADPDVVILSCSSSINSGDLAAVTKKPENFVVAHPLQPAHMMPVVEVIGHDRLSAETRERVVTQLKALDRAPAVLNRSINGFLVNRFQQALYRESIYLIEEGVTTAEDIDVLWKWLGMRYASIGILEFYDDVGLPLESTIHEIVLPTLCNATTTQELPKKLMAEGHTGIRTGKGLRDWSKIDLDDYRYRKTVPFLAPAKNWPMPE